ATSLVCLAVAAVGRRDRLVLADRAGSFTRRALVAAWARARASSADAPRASTGHGTPRAVPGAPIPRGPLRDAPFAPRLRHAGGGDAVTMAARRRCRHRHVPDHRGATARSRGDWIRPVRADHQRH